MTTETNEALSFDDWLVYGVAKGYCTPQYCDTHDGGYWTETEAAQLEEGYDPCCHVVRLGQPQDWLNEE